jgi:hypothetical protein
MKHLLPFGLAALATMALAQTQPPAAPAVPEDCTTQHPCAVTYTEARGWAGAHSDPPGLTPPPLTPSSQPDHPRGHIFEGPEVLSLEEVAVGFFSDIAIDDSHPSGVLWNHYDLTDAEAAEVLAVARRAAATEAQQAHLRQTREHEQLCEELHQAGTADAQLAALQHSDDRSFAATKAAGAALLDQLSPATRTHVLTLLAEERKSIQVSRADWVKVRNTQPEALEMLRAQMCPN